MWSRVFVTEAANKIKEMSGYYSEGEIINIYHQYINIYIPQNSAIQNKIFLKRYTVEPQQVNYEGRLCLKCSHLTQEFR